MRSSPIQNLGGIGRKSNSSLAFVAGEVNGRGTEPPTSIVEQEDPSRAHPARSANNVDFMTGLSRHWAIRCREVLRPPILKI